MPLPFAQFADKPGSWEQVSPRFMHRNGQHPVVAVKGLLHPVTVVRIHIHVCHPHPSPQEKVDSQSRVVEHAEP